MPAEDQGPVDALERVEVSLEAGGIEFAARFLVQKIARERAAYRAVIVYRLEHANQLQDPATASLFTRLVRRAHSARDLRELAVKALRVELKLPDDPTAIEVEGWGEAP